jgi:hypothetical protein
MFSTMARFKQQAVVAGLAMAVVAASALPLLGGDIDAAKKHKKVKAPNIAIQSITLEDHPDPGHNWVVVEVENVGTRDANGFRIGMTAQRGSDGVVRNEEFSLPLSLPKGQSTDVQFRLGCNWINNGAVTVRTDPSPVPGEPANKTANNVLTESYGANVCS